VLFAPFLPFSSQALHRTFGYETDLLGHQEVVEYDENGQTHRALTYRYDWDGDIWAPSRLEPGRPLSTPSPLFAKLDEQIVAEERARLGQQE